MEMSALWILVAVLAILIIWTIATYNRLINLRNRIENAWSQVDVQLKRRYDLIPNLVETVKGYAAHEKTLFENVAKARSAVENATTLAEQGEANNMITSALKSLIAVAEAYPELKANQNFLMLQEELSGTEGKIAYSRQFYNDSVLGYNNFKQSFPANIIASMFNFAAKDYFMAEETDRGPVHVKF